MITVTLTQDEIAERAKSLAQYANKLAELSDEEEGAKARHKQLMADIKERRLDISNELRRLSRAVRLGVEERATQQVFWEEEQRLEEFRREQEVKRRAEGAIEQAEEMIEQQQQAEMEAEASREAVADFFGGEDYHEEWVASLTNQERERYHAAPCRCGHTRDWHGEEDKEACEAGCSFCKNCDKYHCADCNTRGGHWATCEHYVRGEGTPVQSEGFNPGFPPDFDPERAEQGPARVVNLDDYTASRCDECKMIEGGHAQTCSRSNALRFDDYLAYARAHYKTNHQSHARKMELTKLKDDEVRAWKQQVSSGAEVEPEPKKKGRKKLSPVEAAIDR